MSGIFVRLLCMRFIIIRRLSVLSFRVNGVYERLVMSLCYLAVVMLVCAFYRTILCICLGIVTVALRREGFFANQKLFVCFYCNFALLVFLFFFKYWNNTDKLNIWVGLSAL